MKHRYRSTAVCLHENQILGFHAKDPTSGKLYFFLPGGKIEKFETAQESAIRETLEETGYKIKLHKERSFHKSYIFHWDGEDYLTKTEFFPARLTNPEESPAIVNDASYHLGVAWIPRTKVEDVFSYHSDILLAVQECIESLNEP